MSKKYEYKEIDEGRLGIRTDRKPVNTNGKWLPHKRAVTLPDDVFEFRIDFPKTDDYHKAIKSMLFNIRTNEMNDEIVVNEKRISDSIEAIIINGMLDYGFSSITKTRLAVLEMAHTQRFHPLREYLENSQWDGQDRVTSLLNALSFIRDEEWSRSVMKKWLIGSVAKIMEGAQLFMLVLDGPQGCGKSYLVNWLCPMVAYFKEGPINPGFKDTDIDSISTWIWEVAELQATTRKADREALKSHITKQMVRVRAPYGRYAMVKPVTACYIGTINKSAGFLEDESGNRRFVIVEVDRIDWGYAAFDIDQLWAQIYVMYQRGESFNLTIKESKSQAEINKEYDAPHPVIELYHDYYEVDESDQTFTPTMEIVLVLEAGGLRGNQRGNQMKLAEYLNSLDAVTKVKKWDAGLGKQLRGYIGMKQIKFPETSFNGGYGSTGF